MVTCSCCGHGITDEQNVDHRKIPYPHDEGFGMCIPCGGDSKADISTDEGFKKRIGWGMQMFYEARFDLIRNNLNEKNKEKWDKLTYRKKCFIIIDFMEKGIIKW